MTTHDIELPPLPQGEYRLSPDSRAPALYDEEAMEAYARAAIEADRKRRGEPVKVPSDKDILTVWADTPKADSRSGDAIAFARAILAHYGQAAHQGGNNET